MVGIPNVPQTPDLGGWLNTQSVTGFSQFGTQSSALQFTNPAQANPKVNYTWIVGKHSLKVGYEYGWLSQAISDFHPKFGADAYSGQFSSTGAATTVQAANLSDFFFGARSNYQLNAPNEVNYLRQWHFGYLQDNWKALPHLTINAGLRYEFMTPYYEQKNAILNFDPTTPQLLHTGSGTDVNSAAPGHIYQLHYVGGSSLYDRALIDPDYKDFGPRLGFAYQALPGTVIRGSYGISYAFLFRFGGEGLLAYNGPNNYDATLPNNQTPGQGICSSLTEDPTTCFRRTQDGYQNNFAGPANFSTVRAQTRYTPRDFHNASIQASAPLELPGCLRQTEASGKLRLRQNQGGYAEPVTDQQILTLDELLGAAKGKITINLDVKAPIYAEVVDAVVRAQATDLVTVKTKAGIASPPLAAIQPFQQVPFMPILDSRGSDLVAVAQRQVTGAKPAGFELPHLAVADVSTIASFAAAHGIKLLINTLGDGYLTGLAGDNEVARNPDAVWGILYRAGISAFQTDKVETLLNYRSQVR